MPKSKSSKRYFGTSFQLPNPSLRGYFGNVVKGQADIFDTPFAKGESTPELLKAWMRILKSIDNTWPTLWEFENDMASKVGPMSIRKPLEERMTDIDSYYDGVLLPSEPVDHSAVAAVIREWKPAAGLSPRDEKWTVSEMKKSTNSGSPFFQKRRDVVDQTLFSTVTHDNDFVYQLLGFDQQHHGREYTAAALLGWRGQEGGYSKEDVKQRVIWMFPFAVNIAELRVYQPLIELAQRNLIVPAWVSMELVDRRITELFDTKPSEDLVVCTDFSKFDQHFNKSLQDVAQEVLRATLDTSRKSTDWLERVFPIKYMIPLAYNWEQVRFGSHGMASGSGGTNADETLAHRSLQYEAAQRAGAKLNPNSQCLGDDGILTYPGITVEDVVATYTKHGLDMNPDKQYASPQDCVYLRRWHHKDYRVGGTCVGVYSTCRALGRLRYLERYMNPKYWDRKMVALRQMSILENVKWHPLRDEFVEFCMARDRYRLGMDIPGFLANIKREAKKAMDYMPDFLGYTKTLQSGNDPTGGIESWWITRYLIDKKLGRK